MDLHWQLLHRSTLEDALWVVHWEFHQVASMALAGDCSLGIPWHDSMGNALGCHGLALGLLMVKSMEVLDGYAIGMSTWESHGLALATAP